MASWLLEKDPLGDHSCVKYCDVVKCDMKAVDVNTESWESLEANWSKWRGALTNQLKAGEEKLTLAAES